MMLSLFVLGLGGNPCFVSRSTLLSDQLSQTESVRTQGFSDTLMALASALGSFGSGLIFAAVGFHAMAAIGAVIGPVPLAAEGRCMPSRRPTAEAAPPPRGGPARPLR